MTCIPLLPCHRPKAAFFLLVNMRHYRRIRLMSSGRFGTALLVTEASTQRLCVLKARDVSALESSERRELQEELVSLAKLRHPHLCGCG